MPPEMQEALRSLNNARLMRGLELTRVADCKAELARISTELEWFEMDREHALATHNEKLLQETRENMKFTLQQGQEIDKRKDELYLDLWHAERVYDRALDDWKALLKRDPTPIAQDPGTP